MNVPNEKPLTLDDLNIEIDQTANILRNVNWHKENFVELTTIGFLLSILEQSHTIHALCEKEKYFEAKIILRSALEHFIEIILISKDDNEKYVERIKLEFNYHQVKTLNAAKSGNQYVASIVEKIDVAVNLEELAQYKEEIEKQGGKKLSVIDRFKSAGHGDMYDTIYSSLSKLAHPTFAGIIERHFVIDQQIDEFSVHAFRAVEADTIILIIDMTIGLLRSIRSVVDEKFPQLQAAAG